MNIRYYHDFIGDDNIQNRFEILTRDTVVSKQVEATRTPFVLEYQEVKKLTPIQGSQATIGLISKSNFQFTNLHTDDMQWYQVKFYRAGKPYWVGWLDAELYNEQISAVPPYPVEFSAADFNIWERLKYRDENEKRYTDIVPFMTHLKRCFDRLNLPFDKLYIGCTTTPDDVSMSVSETALHILYMMSDNFYDEEKEPMTCREVVESILQPFGLMMVQKNANVYIYDYNTIKLGLPMKRYNFSTFFYEADEKVNFNHGNLVEIGFASTEGDYGFEEMVNNVTITSSLYAAGVELKATVDEETVSEEYTPDGLHVTDANYYKATKDIDNINDGSFVIYKDRHLQAYVGEKDTVSGCFERYTPSPESVYPVYRVKYPNYITKIEQPNGQERVAFYINLKMSAYPGTTSHPILQEALKDVDNSGVLKLYCNLYFTDETGKRTVYLDNVGADGTFGWKSEAIKQGQFVLWFSGDNTDNSILDNWTTNANMLRPMIKPTSSTQAISSSLVGKGYFTPPYYSGYLVFEITNKCQILNPVSEKLVEQSKIKMLLYNDIDISIVGPDGNSPSTDDYEFKSYVNKKVASDFEDITLKCISANTEAAPIGKANMLKIIDNQYQLQTSFTRYGQTDILERLLMRTIHSNFTTKNGKMMVDVKMTENPALAYISCNPILSGSYLVTGCTLDFHAGITTISAVGYSEDTAKLSSIPYND